MSNSPNEGPAQMAQDRAFSSRWGISTPRHSYVRVPNYFFDCYAEAGVTGTEFLLILHLARYQFEKPGSRCCPSVETVARQMGSERIRSMVPRAISPLMEPDPRPTAQPTQTNIVITWT